MFARIKLNAKFWRLTYAAVLALFVCIVIYTDAQTPTPFFDFINLALTRPEFSRAYSKVNIDVFWQLVDQLHPVLSSVTVGVIDSGIDAGHPEFEGVNLGQTSFSARTDHEFVGHGTQVTGIIAANDRSATSSSNYIFPQMNGVASIRNFGPTVETRFDGGKNLYAVLFEIAELSDLRGASILNMSTVFTGPGTSCIFPVIAQGPLLASQIVVHPDTLFVVAAGTTIGTSTVLNAECYAPGNLGNNLNNVITVGGITLRDSRQDESPFGAAVNIAASAENVYAPAPRGLGDFPPTSTNAFNYSTAFGGPSAAAPLVPASPPS